MTYPAFENATLDAWVGAKEKGPSNNDVRAGGEGMV